MEKSRDGSGIGRSDAVDEMGVNPFSEGGVGTPAMVLVVKVTKEEDVGGRCEEEREGEAVLKKGFSLCTFCWGVHNTKGGRKRRGGRCDMCQNNPTIKMGLCG
jgi:hypothetical protein